MHRRIATRVLALTALLLAATGVAVAHSPFSAATSSVAHPSLSVHPAASDHIYPSNRYGGFDATFSPGLYNGHIFFVAYDPTDKYAKITLTDQNASRDGVASPAASWNATFNATNGFYNYSYQSNGSYEIPFGLVHSGMWNLTISGQTAGVFNASLAVQTYDAYLQSDAPVYLPGHVANVSYVVRAAVNSAPFSMINSIVVSATYTNTASKVVSALTTPTTSLPASWTGSLRLTMPGDVMLVGAYKEIYVQFWVNQTTGGTWSYHTAMYLYVGTIYTNQLTLAACLSCGSTSTFQSGQIAYLTLQEYISSGGFSPRTAPAMGLGVRFTFEAAGTIVPNVPGSPPLTDTTNYTGAVAILFIANGTVFSTVKANSIVINVTDPAFGGTTSNFTTTFNVLPTTQGIAAISVTLDASQYYSGDHATATWVLGGVNAAATSGWQVDSWYVVDDNTGAILGIGSLNTTATTGTIPFVIPTTFRGGLDFYVFAHNQTGPIDGSAFAEVTAPIILLTASEHGYSAGDTITITVTTEGQVFQGATLFGSVTASSGGSLYSGVISGTSFTVTIPKVAPPSYILATVAAQTAAGVITSAQIEVQELSGIALSASLSTASHYDDGSYQPGETVQIAYSISAHGAATLGKAFVLDVYPDTELGYQSKTEIQTTSSSGTVSYTIPSSLSNGAQLIYIEAYVVGCSSYCYSYSSISVPIQSSPPALGYELGSGTGITVGWLILLVLIIVVAIVLLIKMRGAKRTVMMHPLEATGPAPSTSTGPTSPSGSSSGSPSSGSGDTSSGSPPLPTPPH